MKVLDKKDDRYSGPAQSHPKNLEPCDYLGMLCIVPIEETRDAILVDWGVEWLLEVSD
jgi:hypothetical protein